MPVSEQGDYETEDHFHKTLMTSWDVEIPTLFGTDIQAYAIKEQPSSFSLLEIV